MIAGILPDRNGMKVEKFQMCEIKQYVVNNQCANEEIKREIKKQMPWGKWNYNTLDLQRQNWQNFS